MESPRSRTAGLIGNAAVIVILALSLFMVGLAASGNQSKVDVTKLPQVVTKAIKEHFTDRI